MQYKNYKAIEEVSKGRWSIETPAGSRITVNLDLYGGFVNYVNSIEGYGSNQEEILKELDLLIKLNNKLSSQIISLHNDVEKLGKIVSKLSK